ncbi:MAG: hypothetical protein EPN79_01430 [Burkholderiaceae bacterium]|nr:MAG: hypothetical protein EPN79_01430 [Burkholderiaceae bacterium]TBR75688.1 MAG: hypothetical protein EPN64_11515 [Burkholderiaceae bacterium]
MDLNLSTSDHTEYRNSGLISETVGSLVIAFALMPASAAVLAQPAQVVPREITIVNCATSDTQQSSMVKMGLLQDDQTTLISEPAKDAIGLHGLKRLKNFFRLQAGWDGAVSKPIDLSSIGVFSRFFAETHLCPERLGVFMSGRGNVVVNWLDQDGHLVELEFHSAGVDYFIEGTGDEGMVSVDDVGFSKLFKLVSESVRPDGKG